MISIELFNKIKSLSEDDNDLFEERAAIIEYMGGLSRVEANQKAYMLISQRRKETFPQRHGRVV